MVTLTGIKKHRLSRSQNLEERCSILAEIVQRIAPVYSDPGTSENQRQLIETMIGAAIWYMPQGGEFWTSHISVGAIRTFHPASGVVKPKLTQDHEFPRKVAANELLNLNWQHVADPGAELLQRYREKYGRFNYITSTENRQLMRFQRTTAFSASAKAYEEAGIILRAITRDDLARLKLRDESFVASLVSTLV